MNEKLRSAFWYIEDRLKEPGTWQGIAFLLTLAGCKLGADFDTATAVTAAASVSALLKMFFPDLKR